MMHRIITCTWFLYLLVLLISTRSNTKIAAAWSDYDEFFYKCPPTSCSKDGPQIRFPYRLSTSPPSCGAIGMELSCSGNDTILQLPNIGTCKVLDIFYSGGLIKVDLGEAFSFCEYQKVSPINFTTAVYQIPRFDTTSENMISCTADLVNKSDYPFNYYDGPVTCFSNSSQLVYFADGGEYLQGLPSFCTVLLNNISLPIHYLDKKDIDHKSNESVYVTLTWFVHGITEKCIACEGAGKNCAGGNSFCPHHSPNMKLIGVISSTALVLLLLLLALPCYKSRRTARKEHLRQEELLAVHCKTANRYAFSEIKKMTNRFKDKLGQGGYGSVFKGELQNGIQVAVKVLERSTTNSYGRDFINEVATIGTIHHLNVVRLLGFSSEGSRHALVYEFMPNGSLDKYISSKSSCRAGEMHQMEILLNIAIGVANGIKYLHEGCIQRILHFDIKPHNILLDHNLNPKIADFGLAKLCSKDRSEVTVTVAKGTIGYMAPEVYSKNFGNVSYKSDVYSFGMLILKMVIGEKNLIPDLECNSEVYYPEVIYEKLVNGEDLESVMEVEPTEADIKKKLIIVAFWCIQWNPAERPHMGKVVQMLGSDLQTLEIPPKPFVS
ncbi:Protein kinase family protein [Rhynchospora pubera]|uniref:Protein kinase family protein n=1 Tax=Rhynchospora pubera TaxID=906938 RepID=A0AAV8DR35_9POAL|nr:Protein kinase family protein [Rhynchospora pubera]